MSPDRPARVSRHLAAGLPVLVVGGGPAGLVAAIELARRDVRVRLIERSTHPKPASRAKGLQPRTLEMLEALGVIDDILAAGDRFPRWRSYRAGEIVWEKSIYELAGTGQSPADPAVPYPETWMIPQWRTEEILRDALHRLDVSIEYGSSLIALDGSADSVVATIRRPHSTLKHRGRDEQIRVSYVVAADGAASTVRKLMDISFDGVTRDDERFVIADVRSPDLDRTAWHNWSDPDDARARVSICPLPGTDIFQLGRTAPYRGPVDGRRRWSR